MASELTTASYHPPNVDCHPAQALANNINNIFILYTRRNAKTFYLNLFSYFGDEFAFRSKLCTFIYIYFPHIIYIPIDIYIHYLYIPPKSCGTYPLRHPCLCTIYIHTTVTVRLACACNSPLARARELNNKEIVAAAAAAAASAARFYWVTAVCIICVV